MRWSQIVVTVVAVWACSGAPAQESPLYTSTQTFLQSLTPEQKTAVALPFNSEERLNWHFIPKERLGLPFRDLTEPQRALLLDLLRAGLSEHGFTTIETIRSLEPVLREMEGRDMRNPELYFLLVFGEPSADKPWSIRYEGHHISLSWTFAEGKLAASSPQFLGANPAEVRIEGPKKGLRALASYEDMGRALLKSLDAAQQKKTILEGAAPNDILTSNAREAAIIDDKGITYAELNETQQGLLLGLIDEVARVQPPAITKYRLDQIREAGLDGVRFAWMGGAERGDAHYYRIQGSTFLIEYDNTQNEANHVHLVWRDYAGDFGRDALKEHYALHFDPATPRIHAH